MLGPLDSSEALRAWADAAVENLAHSSGHGACTLAMLAGSTSPGDEQTRAELCSAFLRSQSLLLDGLRAMRERGGLRPEADLDKLSMALLTALQGVFSRRAPLRRVLRLTVRPTALHLPGAL